MLDNAQIHTRPNVRNIIADSGNEVVYTLSYSPILNPIEQIFNQLKHYIKVERTMNLRKLKENVKRALEKVKRFHYQNYLTYAYDNKQLPKIYKVNFERIK
jgi:transposase